MTSARVEQDGCRPRPPVAGSFAYLLMNLPVGIAAFVTLLTLSAVGIGTAIVWVGVPIAALAVLIARGGAGGARQGSRATEHLHRDALPATAGEGAEGQVEGPAPGRRDLAGRRLPRVAVPDRRRRVRPRGDFWATGLALAALPIYFRFLPEGKYFFPAHDVRWITVAALPWAAFGVLLIALSVALTRALGTTHARFARALLGPAPNVRRFRRPVRSRGQRCEPGGRMMASTLSWREAGR